MKNNIRIFLSSTFKDMQQERDYIVRNVFPELRNVAEERGIPFSWCDLRFGVFSFDEESIIRLCLKNIECSYPWFVGLLGGSYGSIPQNLNKAQIRRLSVFHGIPSMIKRKYGYTEIEMRYFISQKDENDCFDFYFFIGEFNVSNRKFYDCKYFFTHPLSIIPLFLNNSSKDKLSSWKRYIFTKSTHNAPTYWHFDENEPVDENIIYKSIRHELERKFSIQQFPKEELIWNEQQTYMHSQVSEAFFFENMKNEIRYDDSKDILNLYSPIATGKTVYVANLLKKSSENGSVCFYYFIGASRNLDTLLNIWKCILYQVCKYRNIDYSFYNHINDIDELIKVITRLIHQISTEVLIAIDGFDDDVTCSLEHKNTFTSNFPDPQDNIKYILSSSQKLSETSRVLSVEHKITNSIIQKFIKKYLKYYYGYSIYNQRVQLQCRPKDLRESCYCIDEYIINTLQKRVFDNEKVNFRNNLYECIKNRIISNINRQSNFYEGDKESFLATINDAIQVLSLTKYGIIESDICNICNINAEQWTIIYSYLSPFFKSKGCIKLQKPVAEQFISTECVDDIRKLFIENLKKNNRLAQYTKEILYQASQLESKNLLCEILSGINILNSLYETDKDLLAEYLMLIDKACLIDDFGHFLDVALNKQQKQNHYHCYFRIINIFYDVLPRYAIALHYIDISNRYINDYPISVEHQLEYNAQKINIYIEMGKFNEALEFLQLSDKIIKYHMKDSKQFMQYTINNLFLKAKLYDNDLQGPNEKIKALSIYRELINKYQDNLETDIILHVLDRYIMLEKHKENMRKYINIFTSIFSNKQIVKENSHLSYKYAVKQIVHQIFNSSFDVESKEIEDLFTTIFCKLDEYLQMYPCSKDTCNNILFVVELLFVRINNLKSKNIYKKSKENIIKSQILVEKFVSLSNLIYNNESIGYAKAMFQAARLYDELAYIFPIDKIGYLNKSIEYSIKAVGAFNKINQGDNILTAKLYHNIANACRKLGDFENAILYINKAIDIKSKLMQSNDNSLFESKMRRISILIDQIMNVENVNSIGYEIKLCKSYLNKLKIEVLHTTDLIEPKSNDRINRIKESKIKFNKYIKNPEERYLQVAKNKFEECKRLLDVMKTETTKITHRGLVDNLIVLCNKAKELEFYLQSHELHQRFYERCNDYRNFENFFYKLYAILGR